MTADHQHHRPYEELAVRHVMGSLDAGEASAFRSHLLDCLECRARVGELRSIASDLAGVERDERRERAAQRVETKQRDDEDQTEEQETFGSPRGGRAVFVVSVLLIILLSVWNFVLRGQNEGLQAALDAERDSSAVINFGEAWTPTARAAGVEGAARIERGSLAVMVRGTDDEAPYQVTLFDAAGEALLSEPVSSRDQQVRYFRGPISASVARVDVTLDRRSGATVIFRAVDHAVGGPDDADQQQPSEAAAQ